jgi:ADP-heptose:LPS heptosyltransferase
VGDFADNAALLANLDLLVTVDTAAGHLAGALGIPAWIMLPANPDWRWMWGREDSPWYPGVKLLRQPVLGDWAPVVERVARDLQALAARPA